MAAGGRALAGPHYQGERPCMSLPRALLTHTARGCAFLGISSSRAFRQEPYSVLAARTATPWWHRHRGRAPGPMAAAAVRPARPARAKAAPAFRPTAADLS